MASSNGNWYTGPLNEKNYNSHCTKGQMQLDELYSNCPFVFTCMQVVKKSSDYIHQNE